ncbi:MAG: 1-acyl-sn-glycerol-3-phosphate acyltransferase [Spirochaetaceae bacterium]|nr:1-acyl-sn-glycerol-3-phosphate acyltransferase [Spirochaetaceae bacterium]
MARWYQDFMWMVVRNTFCRSLNRNYNIEAVFHDEEPESPFILMANHSHKSDPYMIGGYMKNTLNYMANIDGVSNLQRKLADLIGAYGKKKGAPDFKAIKHTIELLKGGHSVGIFPEGDRSWDGETAEFIPGTASLAKKYKVPIRLARLTGNYLSMPRWADFPRKGRILIDFYTISVEEIMSMGLEELEAKIWSVLYHNDIKCPLNKEVVFTGENLASGIQRLLWLCPHCGTQDSLQGEGDSIVCSSCGEKWLLDGSLRFSPEGIQGADLKDWTVWQKEEMKKICHDNGRSILTKTDDITLSEVQDREDVNSCHGDLVLYHDRVEFNSVSCEPQVFRIESMVHYIDNFNKVFEFDYDKKRYRILFEGKNASKWIFFLDYLKNIH